MPEQKKSFPVSHSVRMEVGIGGWSLFRFRKRATIKCFYMQKSFKVLLLLLSLVPVGLKAQTAFRLNGVPVELQEVTAEVD